MKSQNGLFKAITLVTCFVALSIFVIYFRQDRSRHPAGDNVEILKEENRQLSNSLAGARSTQKLSKDQLAELMRLRSQVGRLRQEQREILVQRSNTIAIGTKIPNVVILPQIVNKESWEFKGYSTPENAIESVSWAISKGDFTTFFHSLTPQSQELIVKQIEGKADAEISKVISQLNQEIGILRLDRKTTLPEGDVQFIIRSKEEDNGQSKFRQEDVLRFQNLNNEWRLSLE